MTSNRRAGEQHLSLLATGGCRDVQWHACMLCWLHALHVAGVLERRAPVMCVHGTTASMAASIPRSNSTFHALYSQVVIRTISV